MKYNKILVASASALSLMAMSSCDGWLDNQPKGFTIPEKYEDYEQLMNSQYLLSLIHI